MNDPADDFCRLFVRSNFDRRELIAFLAGALDAEVLTNLVTSKHLDIAVDRNKLCEEGVEPVHSDSWLRYPYALEIDPATGCDFDEYVEALGTLLQTLWAAEMDAHAVCEFQDRLPIKNA